jgi:hypothetical protein
MLSEFAFANSLAILTGLLYIVFVILLLLAPNLFKFLFNTQFLGADVASLFPRRISAGSFAGTLATLVVSAWVFGYAWVWLYNRFATYF